MCHRPFVTLLAASVTLAVTWAHSLTLAPASQPAEATVPTSNAPAGEASGAGRLNPDALAQDIALARRAIETIHPGYDRSTARPELDAAWDALAARVALGLTDREFYARLSRVLALIRCSHTKAEPSPAWSESRAKSPTYLPFRFAASPGRMVVTASATPALRAGDDILSIEGRGTPALLAEVFDLVPADGWTDNTRWFAVGGMSDLDDCELDHYLPFLVPLGQTVRLEVRSPGDASSRSVTVPMMSRDARAAAMPGQAAPRNLDEALSLTIEGDTAVLTIGTFVAYRKPIQPADLYRPLFERLRDADARTLIIDLRQNGGGSDSAVIDLLRFLLPEPFTPQTRAWVKTYRFGDLADKLDTWDKSVLTLPDELFTKLDNGYYQLNQPAPTFEPLTPTFTGRVIALCGPANQSGATLCLAALKHLRGATLVGEPTGGSVEGPTAGTIFFLPLPHSGVRVRIPAIRSVTGLPSQPGLGATPDVLVPTTPDDLAAGRDPVLAKAKALAAER